MGCGFSVPSAGLVRSQGLAVLGCGSGLICAWVLALLGGCAGPGVWVAASTGSCARGECEWCVRAGRWPVASLGVPHGGVDGRAGGVRSVQVGQQRAHVQGVGVPDEDLTEDRGVGGKQYAMPGRGGGEEREDVRGPRRGGEHDVGRVRPRERCWGEQDHRTAVYCEVPSGAMVEEPD